MAKRINIGKNSINFHIYHHNANKPQKNLADTIKMSALLSE
jgi:hypothetical protein